MDSTAVAEFLAYYRSVRSRTRTLAECIPEERLEERPEAGRSFVWKWLRLMLEHEVHHRAQLYEILGGFGVDTPPLCGLTEPEVRARGEL